MKNYKMIWKDKSNGSQHPAALQGSGTKQFLKNGEGDWVKVLATQAWQPDLRSSEPSQKIRAHGLAWPTQKQRDPDSNKVEKQGPPLNRTHI